MDPIGSLIVGFVLGVLSGVAVRLLIDWILQPRVEIEGNDSIVVREIRLHHENGTDMKFFANRIRVKNKGKSAAKDCKVYVEYPQDPPRQRDTERGAWMIPHERSGYTITLNVKDREFVDLCATTNEEQTRVIPLEYGYSKETIESCTILPPHSITIVIRVTSSNAKPTEKEARLHNDFNHFPDQNGRIVEFIMKSKIRRRRWYR